MLRSFLPTILLLTAAVGSVFALPGDFKPSETSAKATWFAHVNFVSLRSSEIGKQLVGELDREAKQQLKQVEKLLSFHPIDDLESATFYGTSTDPEQAVALVRGGFDVESLTKLITDAKDYAPVTHKIAIIHSWKDSGHRIYATVANDRLVIIGPELELVRTATDVIESNGAALDETKIFGHAKTDHSPILVASADLTALDSINIDSSLVRKIQAVYFSAGEKDGELLTLAAMKTEDDHSAQLVHRMLQGVLALAEASDEVPPEIIQAIETKLTSSAIAMSVSLPLNQFKTLVAKLEKAAEGL